MRCEVDSRAMTPQEFADIQVQQLAETREQNRLLRRIGDGVQFLAWAIVIALAILLMMSLTR